MSDVNVPLDPQKSDLIEEDHTLTMLKRPGKFRTLICLGLFALVLMGAFFLQEFNLFLMGIFGLLATVGVFAILGFSSGLIEVNGQERDVNIFAAYADELTDGMIITHKKGHVLYANDAYFHILGRSRSKQIPTVESYFSGDPSISEPLYRLCQAARQKRVWEDEFAIVEPLQEHKADDGESEAVLSPVKWLRISVRPIKARDGIDAVEAVVWRVKDVTLERSQRDLEFQDLNLAVQHFDQSPMGFFTLDQNGDISYMNGTMAGWLGFEGALRGGLSITEILPQEGVQLLQQALTPYSSLRGVQYYDLVARDGTSVRTILYGRPMTLKNDLEHAEDTHYGVVAFGLDDAPYLFEQQQMTEMRLEQFYHSAPIGIATIDSAGKIFNANGSFQVLLGEGREELGSEVNLFKFISEEQAEELRSTLEGARGGQGVLSPIDVEFTEGGERRGRLFFSSALDMAQDGAVAIIYAIDTTQQRALEEQFAQSQKMQAVGQLAGGIAHDFNNVLTAIIGYCDLLIGSHRPTDPAFKDMMHIKQNANRAANLVRQLLAFSRQQTLRAEVLSLNDVIQDVTAMLSRLLGENITLDVRHGRDLWSIKADHHQLDQVIINLAVNARDAMAEGGTLSIRTENIAEHRSLDEESRGLQPGEYVLLEITDTGTGMPQEVIDKIFEPFFTTKDIGKGTGLGLSMVYGIIKQTDGFVFVDSQPGEGTSFKIYLPRHVVDETAQPVEVAPPPAADKPKDLTGSECVLLVEDEEAVRSFAARALGTRGYKVLEAHSGVDALDVVAQYDGRIDLVVSDVMMPEMDGPTMLSKLRERLPDVKVIFISGYAEDAFDKNLDEGEEFTFLPKPFSLKQLAATVKDVLGG